MDTVFKKRYLWTLFYWKRSCFKNYIFLVLFAFFEVVPQHTDVVNLFCKKTTRIYASFTGQLTITVNRIIHDDGDTGPVLPCVTQGNTR